MAAAPFRLAIAPRTAVGKFLVDMRLYAGRSWRPFSRALSDALAACGLTSAERRVILDLNPLEDFFYAGMVALHAFRLRELFAPQVAETLLRELALQVDSATGREDGAISNLVFLMLGRIRKARQEGNHCDHDQVVEKLLERVGLHKDLRTRPIMTNLALRHSLAAPLALASPNWWESFVGLYLVQAAAPARRATLQAQPRRAVDPRITAPPQTALRVPARFAAWFHARRSDQPTDKT
jgi:hypothetical protein